MRGAMGPRRCGGGEGGERGWSCWRTRTTCDALRIGETTFARAAAAAAAGRAVRRAARPPSSRTGSIGRRAARVARAAAASWTVRRGAATVRTQGREAAAAWRERPCGFTPTAIHSAGCTVEVWLPTRWARAKGGDRRVAAGRRVGLGRRVRH